MPEFWVVDTKCKALPESPIPQDGSEYYFGRSVVPASSKEEAIALLTDYLKDEKIIVEKTIDAIIFENGDWSDDDDFDVKDSFEEAVESNEIELGCFVSEKSKIGA